ncbi:fimbrial protein [Enterobacter asburiae]|uniref:fimbrial protein n=1 Tax=Enterobacter asburiae TaxID=61645 RepID=UPI003BE5C496
MQSYETLRRIIYGMVMGYTFLSSPLNADNITSTQFTITGVLEAKTCAFNETSSSVTLPEVDTLSLNSSNSIQGSTFFPLSFNCNGGVTSISIKPYGSAVSNGDKTLFLNTNSAKNVGLRLLDKYGNILTPDGQTEVTFNYQGSSDKYTFTAGYAATGSGRVSGGTFQSMVIFTMTYS